MTIQTTDNTTNAVRTRYTGRYQKAARARRLYDQLATPVSAAQNELEKTRGMGTSYTFNFASDMEIGTTAINQTSDIVPQAIVDAVSTITPTSLGEAMKWSEMLGIQEYTNGMADRAEKVGDNAMESIDNLAMEAALKGSVVLRGQARASLDAGTATDNWTEAAMWKSKTLIDSLKMPIFLDQAGRSVRFAIAHSDAFYDLFHGGNVMSSLIYGGLPGMILLNGEIGEIAGFRLLISPFAKVFGGAGADNASDANYALSADSAALALTLGVTTGTNAGAGRLLTVGTEETGNTFYPRNERVKHISGTTTSTIVGSGANGGMRFAHTTAEYVRNADSVYPVAYGVPGSLVKIFAKETGAFGELVGPKKDGLADQWESLAWKFYGGYGRVAENRIVRGEYSSSLDA